MVEERANSFLRMIRRSQRGRLKVYLGYCAGVGKTYQMLQEGHRLKDEGIDVVIGLLETHGRAEIARLAEGLEVIPRRRQEYHGVTVEEMDVDAILARKPQVALIDELAHTNVPGSLNPKRYQDVQDILATGIHVITTMNVQHLESLYNTVEKAVGVKVRERLPDSVLAEADQIVDVDVSTEDLQKRLREGRIYPKERIETALVNFFRIPNLERLRELTLRELASQIDLRRREAPEEEGSTTPDQVMVCLSSCGPNSERLLRYASRLAGRLNRNWYAVYVQTPSEEATVIDAQAQRFISDTLTLAKQLGAMVFTYKGEDVADTIFRFAKEYRVGHIVIGRPTSKPFWKRFGRNRDIVKNLIKNARGVTLIVLDTREEEPLVTGPPLEISEERAPTFIPSQTAAQPPDRLVLSRLLSPRRIVIWDQPVQKEVVLRTLTEAIGKDDGIDDVEALFRAVMKREEEGSTFFNEGVAFPHVRINRLATPVVALGLTRQGVSDVSTEKPIELVFLILSPDETPDTQIHVLGLASRAAQNRHLFQNLRSVRTPQEAMGVILGWERPMTRTCQPNPDVLSQSKDTTPQSRRKAFPSVIERYLRFIENAQRRSHEALIGRVLEEKAVLLKSQAKAVMARRPEVSGAPISFEGERRELNMKGRSILIVDDEKNIRLTLSHALDVLQAETDMAVDGDEALTKLKMKEYGLILLDLRLPDMNGMDVLCQIREIRPDIRVIMMTAYGTIESAVKAMKLGACDFIQKPFLPEEIRNLVSRVMDSEKFDEQKVLDYASSIELAKRSVGDRHFEAALEHVRKAISLDPNRPEAFNLLGALMEIQGDCMEAQKKYRAALSLDPSYKPALENLRRSTTPYPRQKGHVSLGLQSLQKEKAE